MYRISDDKRVIDSANRFQVALNNLLDKYPFTMISVSMICSEAGISRTTFYRLFDVPADIIDWYCMCATEKLRDAIVANGVLDKGWPFQYVVRYILSNPLAFEFAYKAKRVDLADVAFCKTMTPLLEDVRLKNQIPEIDMYYATLIVSAVIGAAFSAWIKSGKQESEEVIYERVLNITKHIQ